ncbi:hypothetical protein HY638_03660 [Candidatus Woesearchaeota archaeon]|nr:hypothetical protein [Candidatus Woesearchaeota archaeon]
MKEGIDLEIARSVEEYAMISLCKGDSETKILGELRDLGCEEGDISPAFSKMGIGEGKNLITWLPALVLVAVIIGISLSAGYGPTGYAAAENVNPAPNYLLIAEVAIMVAILALIALLIREMIK